MRLTIDSSFGTQDHPRFAIFDQETNRWFSGRNGKTFSEFRQDATLYYWEDEANEHLFALEDKTYEGKPVRSFEGKISVSVVGNQDYDLEALMAYLQRAAILYLDNSESSGPSTNSLARVTIDWADLKEKINEQNS